MEKEKISFKEMEIIFKRRRNILNSNFKKDLDKLFIGEWEKWRIKKEIL